MAEDVNPEIIRFVKEEENRILRELEAVADPFDGMIQDTLADSESVLNGLDQKAALGNPQSIEMPDMSEIKRAAELTLPPAIASIKLSTRMRTDATIRLGFYTVLKIVQKAFKKAAKNQTEEKILALKDGIRQLKRETEKSIAFHFKNYRENLKFQYVFKLVDAASAKVYDVLLDRFQLYAADLSALIGLIGEQEEDRERALKILKEIAVSLSRLNIQISRLKNGII